MQQVLMHFLLRTLPPSVDGVRILLRLTQELFAVEHLGRLEEATDNNHCFFCPASPHFVYHNLFMGGEDELRRDVEKGKARVSLAPA